MMSPAGINVLTYNMSIKEILAAARLTLYAMAHTCPAMTPCFPTAGTVKGGLMRKVSGLTNTKSQEKKVLSMSGRSSIRPVCHEKLRNSEEMKSSSSRVIPARMSYMFGKAR